MHILCDLWAVVASSGPVFYQSLLGPDGRLQWETLVGGALALVAAWFTVKAIRAQIAQADQAHREAWERRHRAARAVLPMALNEISEYSSSCIRTLWELRSLFNSNGTRGSRLLAKKIAIDPLSENAISVLRECIESGPAAFAEAATELISRYQIHRSRLLGRLHSMWLSDPTRIVFWANIESDMADAAEVGALALCLLPFARGDSEHVFLPNSTLIEIAARSSGVFESDAHVAALVECWKADLMNRDELRDSGLASLGLEVRQSKAARRPTSRPS